MGNGSIPHPDKPYDEAEGKRLMEAEQKRRDKLKQEHATLKEKSKPQPTEETVE